MKSLKLICAVAGLIVAFAVVPALGAPVVSNFNALMGYNNDFISGGGDGWTQPGTNLQWFPYPQGIEPDPADTWWNTWFYNDEYDPLRWKVIDLTFTTTPIDPDLPAYGQVTINWSTGPWSLQVPPPQAPPLEDFWPDGTALIGRDDPADFYIPSGGSYIYEVTDYILPPDYNPEWVSIDIRGSNFKIEGVLIHECVPAPGAILLGSLGVGIVGWLRRRRAL